MIVKQHVHGSNTTPKHILFKLQKIKDREKILKEAGGGRGNTYRGTRIRITLGLFW